MEESDSDLDYGRDSDDSDDDYEEGFKPWQQKQKKVSQLAKSSDDESMGVEEDQQMPGGASERRTEDVEAELEDYTKVWIPRRRLIRWCNEPFFGKAVKNFYVRLGIGRDNKTQKACYRLCRINGVKSKDEYTFPQNENQQKPVSGLPVCASLCFTHLQLSHTITFIST
jgi:RNA polymerase-associated protein RTF1